MGAVPANSAASKTQKKKQKTAKKRKARKPARKRRKKSGSTQPATPHMSLTRIKAAKATFYSYFPRDPVTGRKIVQTREERDAAFDAYVLDEKVHGNRKVMTTFESESRLMKRYDDPRSFLLHLTRKHRGWNPKQDLNAGQYAFYKGIGGPDDTRELHKNERNVSSLTSAVSMRKVVPRTRRSRSHRKRVYSQVSEGTVTTGASNGDDSGDGAEPTALATTLSLDDMLIPPLLDAAADDQSDNHNHNVVRVEQHPSIKLDTGIVVDDEGKYATLLRMRAEHTVAEQLKLEKKKLECFEMTVQGSLHRQV